jgi:hypothetical protein
LQTYWSFQIYFELLKDPSKIPKFPLNLDSTTNLTIHSFEGSSLSTLNSLIKFSTKKLTDRSQLDALKNFDDPEVQAGRTIKQAVERAEANIAWLDKNYKKIVTWLEKNSE